LDASRKQISMADFGELKAAAERLKETQADVDAEEFVAEFKRMRASGKSAFGSDCSFWISGG
jgi:hypothetical protein